ncbi:hypothetical protein GGI00_003555 [Coemansia sp. RSA 2681]|nr:hypothetical protein GGI00_003555 [Coemansia sp. RSA 2681]
MPLLWVCHKFRAFVHARFCSKCELQLEEGRDEYVGSRRSWPLCLRKLNYPTHHLATGLYLDLSIWSIYSGKALQWLSSVPYEGCTFPHVRQLTIGLYLDDEFKQLNENRPPPSLDSYPPETAANIAAFVQRVKQVAPDIRKVDVWAYSNAEDLIKRRDIHIVDLIQQLYDIVEVKTAITRDSVVLVEYLDLEPIRDLVRVTYRIDAISSRIMQLIRRSAQTLQSLDLTAVAHIDYTELIRDPNSGGRWMEYPCLHKLRLFSDYEMAILRGSISNELVAILKRHNVFTPTSHPKLQCININLRFSDAHRAFPTTSEYLQFTLGIAPRASVLTIPSLPSFGGTLTMELEMLGNHDNIQVLSLYSATLSFWDVVNLIKSLPLLSDLETGDPTMDELPQGITLARLPEYARSTYAPMGKRFRCWHISFSPSTRLGNLATCVLVLALICPNFDYAAVDGRHCERFMEVMKGMISEPGFIHHAPRLRRLLFNGWRG